jgi:hypothetical protein
MVKTITDFKGVAQAIRVEVLVVDDGQRMRHWDCEATHRRTSAYGDANMRGWVVHEPWDRGLVGEYLSSPPG